MERKSRAETGRRVERKREWLQRWILGALAGEASCCERRRVMDVAIVTAVDSVVTVPYSSLVVSCDTDNSNYM